jgi:chromosome partitioning protein
VRAFFANLKGGCGKTTAAVTLAVALGSRTREVCLVDADRQGSASAWFDRRLAAGLPGPELVRIGKLGRLRRLEASSGTIIVDCRAGLAGEDLAEHLCEGDCVLVPVLPSILDVDASLAFLAALRSEKKVARGRVTVLPFLNRVRPHSRAAQRVREILHREGWSCQAEIRESSAYALAAFLGKTLFDYRAAAAVELQRDWEPLRAAIAGG